MKPTGKTFRISARKLFMTYSQCPYTPTECLSLLQSILKDTIKSYVISREPHENGGYHLHVYVELSRKCDSRDPKFLDLQLVSEDKSYHGNYSAVRSKNNVIKYILKFVKDTTDESNVLISPDILPYIHSDSDGTYKHLGFSETMIHLARDGQIRQAMALLESVDPDRFLTSHISIRKSLVKIYLNESDLHSDFTSKDFSVPDHVREGLLTCQRAGRTFSLIGPGGTGKSSFMLCYTKEILGLVPLIVNNLDGIRFFEPGLHECIIFDDVDFSRVRSREELIKLLECVDMTTHRVLHGTVRIPKDTPRFIVSNYNLNHYLRNSFTFDIRFRWEGDISLDRRLNEYTLTDSLINRNIGEASNKKA